MVWSVVVDTWKKLSKRDIAQYCQFQTRPLVVSAHSQSRPTIIFNLVNFISRGVVISLAGPATLVGLEVSCHLRQTL